METHVCTDFNPHPKGNRMRKEDGIDAVHTATTRLAIYSASSGLSTVRIECEGLGRTMLKVNENQEVYVIKADTSTMLAFRNVLNRWYDAEVEKRGL
jgi:hypothetical protein